MQRAALALALMACAQLVSANAASGQTLPDSIEGRRVRVTLRAPDPLVEGYSLPQVLRGSVLFIGRDSVLLRLHPDVAPTSVAHAGIDRLELSRGVNRLESAVVRGSGMALPSALYGLTVQPFDSGPIKGALTSGALGFAFGAVLGAVFPEELWRTIFNRTPAPRLPWER